MFKHVVCFGFLGLLLLLGCGTDEVLMPGEEVVTVEWEDPVDIGREYDVVSEVKAGDTVVLSTGGKYEIGPLLSKENIEMARAGILLDHFVSTKDGTLVVSSNMEGNLIRGLIVPEGPPIVSITVHVDELAPKLTRSPIESVDTQITERNNRQDFLPLPFSIKIDRVLDYNLPIYVEFQSQERAELGGEVRRTRYVTVVMAGNFYARAIERKGSNSLGTGYYRDDDTHRRACVSILPYTEMNNLSLPITLDVSRWARAEEIPLEERIIPKGHTFRPYRIASSSFLMSTVEIERNW